MSLFRQGTLAQQTSQVFQMTLDELQNSIAGSGKIGSMNLEEFLAQVWDVHSGDNALPAPPQPASNAPSMNNGSTDYSGKTVEEVWQAIQAGKGQSGEPFDTVNLGSFLQSVGVDMPPSVSTELHATSLSLPSEKALQMETTRMPEDAQMPLIVPQSSQAMTSGNMYYQDSSGLASEGYRDDVHAAATVQTAPRFEPSKSGRLKRKVEDASYMGVEPEHSGGPQNSSRRPKKRKEPEVVDEKTARLQKRMVKNRESAARSRARKQEYTAQLEVQIANLKQENQTLMEKVMLTFASEPSQQGSQKGLRRTKTMPALGDTDDFLHEADHVRGRSVLTGPQLVHSGRI